MKDYVYTRRDETGSTAVEYALLVGLVSLLAVAAAVILGGTAVQWTQDLADTIGSLLG